MSDALLANRNVIASIDASMAHKGARNVSLQPNTNDPPSVSPHGVVGGQRVVTVMCSLLQAAALRGLSELSACAQALRIECTYKHCLIMPSSRPWGCAGGLLLSRPPRPPLGARGRALRLRPSLRHCSPGRLGSAGSGLAQPPKRRVPAAACRAGRRTEPEQITRKGILWGLFFGRRAPNSINIGQCLTMFGPNRANFADFGQNWPDLGQMWSTFRQCLSNLAPKNQLQDAPASNVRACVQVLSCARRQHFPSSVSRPTRRAAIWRALSRH